MPIVIISGWQSEARPIAPPEGLEALLREWAGMDFEEVNSAIESLMNGDLVDAYFDAGEDEAAQDFILEIKNLGLSSRILEEKRQSWFGPSERPGLAKYALFVIVVGAPGLAIGFALQESALGKSLIFFSILLLLSVLVVMVWTSPSRSPAQVARAEKLEGRFRIGMLVALPLIGIIVTQPWIGLVLMAVALCGVASAFVIRAINSRD